ncbi:MAG: dihydroorotate dehydrogenase electron transfer subunit [Bacteroidia bacterium]|nr:dihydroorotate dehydrogenase electron transfer subunit [Bacteroidia bacterium]MCX6325898.1 dihydroorotate dehydrogenase electron transfer subunit [Bacteroidia bacterium]
MAKRIEDLKIIENKRLNNDFFVLELSANDKLPVFKPGQFVQVRVDGSPKTFLRRPISIHDVDYGRNTFKLLIQITGKGTKTLSKLSNGDFLNLIYPLGNSFGLPDKNEKILLVGGGCGVAPLLFLGKYLKSNGYVPDILFGFRNSERIIELEEYLEIGKVFLTTEDGSRGEKGYITSHSIFSNGTYDKIYCCGPDSMMRAIAGYCKKNNIACEVSLENLMACGIGACLCCIVDTVNGNLCTCIDGPVFNITELKW